MKSTGRPGVYKFQSVAQPDCYLGYVDGFIVGYVSLFVAMVITTHIVCCHGDEYYIHSVYCVAKKVGIETILLVLSI